MISKIDIQVYNTQLNNQEKNEFLLTMKVIMERKNQIVIKTYFISVRAINKEGH